MNRILTYFCVAILVFGLITRIAGIESAATNWDEFIIYSEGNSADLPNRPDNKVLSKSAWDFAITCATSEFVTYAPGQLFLTYFLLDNSRVMSVQSIVAGRAFSVLFSCLLLLLFTYIFYRIDGKRFTVDTCLGLIILAGSQLHWVNSHLGFPYEFGALYTLVLIVGFSIFHRLTQGMVLLFALSLGIVPFFNYQTLPLILLFTVSFIFFNNRAAVLSPLTQPLWPKNWGKKWVAGRDNERGPSLLSRYVYETFYRALTLVWAFPLFILLQRHFLSEKVSKGTGKPIWVITWVWDSQHPYQALVHFRETWINQFYGSSWLQAQVIAALLLVVIVASLLISAFDKSRLTRLERALFTYSFACWLCQFILYFSGLVTLSPTRHTLYLVAPTSIISVIALRVIVRWLSHNSFNRIKVVMQGTAALMSSIIFLSSVFYFPTYYADAKDTCDPAVIMPLVKKFKTRYVYCPAWYYGKALIRLEDQISDSTIILKELTDANQIIAEQPFLYIGHDNESSFEALNVVKQMKPDLYLERDIDFEPYDTLGNFPNDLYVWYLRPSTPADFELFLTMSPESALYLKPNLPTKSTADWHRFYQHPQWREETWGKYSSDLWEKTLPAWVAFKAKRRLA